VAEFREAVSRGSEQSERVAHFVSVSLRRSAGGALKPYYLDLPPSPSSSPTTMSSLVHSSSPNLVGGHYRVGRKIGEGSFGVIFEGLLFVVSLARPSFTPDLFFRNRDESS
jgi:hypothetical protein